MKTETSKTMYEQIYVWISYEIVWIYKVKKSKTAQGNKQFEMSSKLDEISQLLKQEYQINKIE